MTLELLDERLRILLPEDYHECYEDIQPVSMGSAGLKYGADGKVAWDEIWGSFCDLAMAGGPPHRGTLLEPGSNEQIAAEPEQYARVVEEICRGIGMVAYLPAEKSQDEGWIRVECETPAKAGWLARAIAMENVSAICDGSGLRLPAGPKYRVEKEIKNVITSVAKTCHYWDDHMLLAQQASIRELLARMSAESPFVQPALAGSVSTAAWQTVLEELSIDIEQSTGLRRAEHRYFGWLGLDDCPTVQAAVWMMRSLIACNLMTRREETTLFVAIDPRDEANAAAVTKSLKTVLDLGRMRNLFGAGDEN